MKWILLLVAMVIVLSACSDSDTSAIETQDESLDDDEWPKITDDCTAIGTGPLLKEKLATCYTEKGMCTLFETYSDKINCFETLTAQLYGERDFSLELIQTCDELDERLFDACLLARGGTFKDRASCPQISDEDLQAACYSQSKYDSCSTITNYQERSLCNSNPNRNTFSPAEFESYDPCAYIDESDVLAACKNVYGDELVNLTELEREFE